jgi:hypothetical protein
MFLVSIDRSEVCTRAERVRLILNFLYYYLFTAKKDCLQYTVQFFSTLDLSVSLQLDY